MTIEKKFKMKRQLYVKKTRKGFSLFSGETLKKGSFIAFYTGAWTSETCSYTNKYSVNVRSFALTPRVKNPNRHLAAMANEPSKGEHANSTLLECEFTKEGKEFLAVALFATKTIAKNSEIMWYYGDSYNREYTVNKPKHVDLKSCENFTKYITSRTCMICCKEAQ